MVDMLEWACWFSPALSGANAAKNGIEALLDIGAVFLDFDEQLNRYPVSNPYSLINPQFRRFEIHHPLFGSEIVKGSLIPRIGYLMLLVPAGYVESRIDEKHAQGLLKIAFSLYSILRPQFCWVDMAGDDAPTEKEIATLTLRHILWANFYGAEYVKKYGRDFFLNAPGWKKEELPNGGIVYILSPGVFDKTGFVSPKEVARYFREKAKVKIYQPITKLPKFPSKLFF